MSRNIRIIVNGNSKDFAIPSSAVTFGDIANGDSVFRSILNNGDQDIKAVWADIVLTPSTRIPDEDLVRRGMEGKTYVEGWLVAMALPKKVKQGKLRIN